MRTRVQDNFMFEREVGKTSPRFDLSQRLFTLWCHMPATQIRFQLESALSLTFMFVTHISRVNATGFDGSN